MILKAGNDVTGGDSPWGDRNVSQKRTIARRQVDRNVRRSLARKMMYRLIRSIVRTRILKDNGTTDNRNAMMAAFPQSHMDDDCAWLVTVRGTDMRPLRDVGAIARRAPRLRPIDLWRTLANEALHDPTIRTDDRGPLAWRANPTTTVVNSVLAGREQTRRA